MFQEVVGVVFVRGYGVEVVGEGFGYVFGICDWMLGVEEDGHRWFLVGAGKDFYSSP